jgi:hypothetical protein
VLPVYSVRLVAVEGLAGDFLYSVPPGYVVVVRDVAVYTAAGTDFRVVGDAGQTFVYWAGPTDVPPSKAYFHWTGRQVIPNGGSFVCRTVAAADVTVSGYLLTGP